MSPALRLNGFRLGLLLAALAAGTGEAAFGEIRASGKNGLRTEVNGVHGGGCNKGVCRIGGGTNAGKNKFHRFKDFDTRGAIERVEFDTGGKHNLVVGVTSAKGTWINKMVALSSKANLFFLSPGGIHLGKGAGFINVPKLSLSTADQLRFAEGTFDVFHSTPESVAAFTTNPLPGVFGMRRSEMDKGVVLEAGQLPGIHLNGINISLDEELLLDAPGGQVNVVDSRLDVGTDEVGGRTTLTGNAISINGGSELIASGRSGGGLIEVGGSWQNSDASVRQAVTAQVEHGAVLDASATVNGDGGEIVVWSDITDSQSLTAVAGSLWATGGSEGGDGGAIETSGFVLDIAGIDVQTSAILGENGLWLLDPYDYTIGSIEAEYIVDALGDQNNVMISTASSTSTAGSNTITADADDDPDGGTITVDAEIDLMCPSGDCGSLILIADKDIQINASVGGEMFEGSGLTLSSKTGVSINSNGAIAWDCSSTPSYPCGPVEISSSVSGGLSGSGPLNTGDSKLIVNQVGDTEFSGTVSGSPLFNAGEFEKQGAGKLTLSGTFNRTRGTTINGGTLSISANQIGAPLADNVNIASGATFSISASQPLTYSGIMSGAGVFRKEGSGTLTLSGASTHSGNTEVFEGSLVVNESLSDSTVVDVSSGATYTLGKSDTIGGLEGAGSVNLNSNELTVSQSATNATFSGIISGSSSSSDFRKAGSGTLILSGANTYQGNTSVDAGVLSVSGSLNDSTIVDVSATATYGLGSSDTIGGLTGAGSVDLNGNELTVSQSATNATFSGIISGSSASSNLRKQGEGNLILSGSNTYGGDTFVDAGYLNVTGSLPDSTIVSVSSGANYTLGEPDTIGGLLGAGSVDLNGYELTINQSASEATFSGIISGSSVSSDLRKQGTGKLIFSGDNDYEGSTFVDAGVLSISGVPNNFSDIVISSDAVLEYDYSSSQSYSGDISGSGGLRKISSGELWLTGALTYTGATNILGGSLQVSSTPISSTSITCSGSGTSQLCPSPSPSPSPTPEPTPEPETILQPILESIQETEPGLETKSAVEVSDPAALTLVTLSGEGYEVSLSLESAFQLVDRETPSIGAVGAEVDGASAQLNPETTAVAEGGGAPISGGPEGTVSSRAGSPELDVSAPSSGSEGYGANATAAALSEEGASGEAEGQFAASDASGAEESGSAEASRSESADAGDGGDEDDGTSASGETEEGESAEGESAAAEAAGEERAVGGDDGEGPSEKPRAPSPAVSVKRVDARRASKNLARGDAQATSRTLQGLNLPDLSSRKTPTPAAIANSLQQVRQRVISGAGPR